MPAPVPHTYQEIMSQPETWESTLHGFFRQEHDLAGFLREHPFDQVLFTGCGSTHYLSMTAASLFQETTRTFSRCLPASELWIYPEHHLEAGGRKLMIAISRSAETSETIEAARIFHRERKGSVLVITNYPDGTLAQEADFVLASPAGQEESVAQTRSFSSMLILAQLLAASAAGAGDLSSAGKLPQHCRNLMDSHEAGIRMLAENPALERFFFLGSGPLYGMASEAMLKMKEMSLSNSEAYHPLEFRHGPMSMVDQHTCVTGLLSEPGFTMEKAVLDDMASLQAELLTLSTIRLPETHPGAEKQILLPGDLPGWAMPVLYLPLLQLLAYYRSLSRGQNPDKPAHLESVVRL